MISSREPSIAQATQPQKKDFECINSQRDMYGIADECGNLTLLCELLCRTVNGERKLKEMLQ